MPKKKKDPFAGSKKNYPGSPGAKRFPDGTILYPPTRQPALHGTKKAGRPAAKRKITSDASVRDLVVKKFRSSKYSSTPNIIPKPKRHSKVYKYGTVPRLQRPNRPKY